MKAFRTSLVGAALTLVAGYAAGCGGSNTTTGGGGGTTTTTTTDPSGEQPLAACSKQGELTGSVSTSRTLTQDTCWTMKGIVYVEPGATLTVEKGTKIAGDPTSLGVLVVKPGAKLVARGTAANPIVFTSSKPKGQRAKGDWGGIILLGKATTNAGVGFITGIEVSDSTLFGGDDDADSSGALEYVRIEFGGGRIGMDSSYNGLTLGAVGSGTLIDHVMVKEGLDDCFGFFGGAVNLKHLICANPDDDGLDWDMGYHGKLQFVAVIQDPVTDAGDDEESNGLEGDNDPMGTETTPRSEPTMYNVTLCGKDKPTMPQYGLLLRRGTKDGELGVHGNVGYTG